MKSTSDSDAKAGANRTARRRLLAAAVGVAAVLAGLFVWRLVWPPLPPPPAVPAEGVDPVVLRALEAARGRVLAAPRSAEAWGGYGRLLVAYNFQPEAIACLTVAGRLDPRNPRWPYLHAVTLLRGITLSHGDADAAGLPPLERAAELCRDDPDAPRLALADFLLKQGRTDEAEAHYRKILARDAGNPRAHLGLARAAAARDDLSGALDQLRACVDSPFTRKAALLLTADVEGRRDDPRAAREALDGAAAARPDAPWPDPFLVEVEEAKVDRRSVLQRARTALEQGRAEEAELLYLQLQQDFPGIDAWEEGQRLLNQGGLRQGAEKVLRRLTPGRPGGHGRAIRPRGGPAASERRGGGGRLLPPRAATAARPRGGL